MLKRLWRWLTDAGERPLELHVHVHLNLDDVHRRPATTVSVGHQDVSSPALLRTPESTRGEASSDEIASVMLRGELPQVNDHTNDSAIRQDSGDGVDQQVKSLRSIGHKHER